MFEVRVQWLGMDLGRVQPRGFWGLRVPGVNFGAIGISDCGHLLGDTLT